MKLQGFQEGQELRINLAADRDQPGAAFPPAVPNPQNCCKAQGNHSSHGGDMGLSESNSQEVKEPRNSIYLCLTMATDAMFANIYTRGCCTGEFKAQIIKAA